MVVIIVGLAVSLRDGLAGAEYESIYRSGARSKPTLRSVLSLLILFAFLAIQRRAKSLPPSLLREDPWSRCHRRLMAHMLPMATLEIGHPMVLFILMISYNSTDH